MVLVRLNHEILLRFSLRFLFDHNSAAALQLDSSMFSQSLAIRLSFMGSNPDQPQSAAAEADLIMRNTYRTLMTRGMKGCYVYCSDEETANYFRERLSPGALAAASP